MGSTERYQSMMTQLTAGNCVVLDGGTGTEISRRGASLASWGAMATVEHPELLGQMYREFIECGAEVIGTNTFGASDLRLKESGIHDREEELNRAAVKIALRARDEAGRDDSVLVAGSITTVGHRGPGGSQVGDPEEERTLESQAAILVDAGADLILLEMLSQVDHSNAQLEAVRTAQAPVWAGFSCKFREDGEVTLLGHDDETFSESLRRIELAGVDVVLVMHSGIDVVAPALGALQDMWKGPCGAYPHAGRWRNYAEVPCWEFDLDFSPAVLADAGADWITRGCQLVGGCCGSTPEHIAALSEMVNRTSEPKYSQK